MNLLKYVLVNIRDLCNETGENPDYLLIAVVLFVLCTRGMCISSCVTFGHECDCGFAGTIESSIIQTARVSMVAAVPATN